MGVMGPLLHVLFGFRTSQTLKLVFLVFLPIFALAIHAGFTFCHGLKTPPSKTSPELPGIHIYLNYSTLRFT